MRVVKSETRQALRRLGLRVLELASSGVFLSVVAHHVYSLDFGPLAKFFLPVLVAMFGFTSLLYMRGRSLGRGKDQIRTLFAAERAMQAAVWHFTGFVVGMSLYGLLALIDIVHDPARPGLSALWLLLFLLPYALVQTGMVLFMRAAWVIAPQFIRRVTPFEVWRRIRHEPA